MFLERKGDKDQWNISWQHGNLTFPTSFMWHAIGKCSFPISSEKESRHRWRVLWQWHYYHHINLLLILTWSFIGGTTITITTETTFKHHSLATTLKLNAPCPQPRRNWRWTVAVCADKPQWVNLHFDNEINSLVYWYS